VRPVDVFIFLGFVLLVGVGLILLSRNCGDSLGGATRERETTRREIIEISEGAPRLFFQLARERLEELYRQALPTMTPRSQQQERTKTTQRGGNLKLFNTASGNVSRDETVIDRSEIAPDVASPGRMAMNIEKHLEEKGYIRRIDFASDEPFEEFLERTRRSSKTIGIQLTSKIEHELRNEWYRNRGTRVGAHDVPKVWDLRGVVSVRGKYLVESAPTVNDPNRPLIMAISAGDEHDKATPRVQVSSTGNDVLEDALHQIREGERLTATAVGHVTSDPTAPVLKVQAIYCYWS